MRSRSGALLAFALSLVLLLGLLPAQTASTRFETEPIAPVQDDEPPRPSEAPEEPLGAGGPLQRSPDGYWFVSNSADWPDGESGSVPLATAGPDGYGYTWSDAITLSWIDVSLGSDTGLTGSSGRTGPVNLPFSFKFYEYTYNQVYIASGGFLTFVDPGSGYTWQGKIPSVGRPNNMIAPYWWGGSYIGSSGWVRYLSGGSAPNRYFVVEWHDVKGGTSSDTVGADDTFRFEAVLYENGDIVFQYQTMTYGGSSSWCTDQGIEDSVGFYGLTFKGFCNRVPSNSAVRFYRPAPAAHAKVFPVSYGGFATPGDTVSFQVPVRNAGGLGADTFDLSASSAWPLSFYTANGSSLLPDTDGDGLVDTGSLAQGETATVTVKVATPGDAAAGDYNLATVTVRSSRDSYNSKSADIRTAVPAPFAQAYRDGGGDGALSLLLAKPEGQGVARATPNNYNGTGMAVAAMPCGNFVYVWSNPSHKVGSVWVSEIEYTILNRYGDVVRPASKLTDHSHATVNTYDRSPAVAVTSDCQIGVVWYRYLWNSSTSQRNYNIHFASLDASGTVRPGITDVTENTTWGASNVNGVPRFGPPRITATEDNRFVMAWQRTQQESAGSVDDIYVVSKDATGQSGGGVTKLTADTPGSSDYYSSPALTALSGDRVLLAYQRGGTYGDIYYAVLDSRTHTVQGSTNLVGDGAPTSKWDFAPRAIQLIDGRIVVAWTTGSIVTGAQVRFAVLDGSYNRLAGPTTLSNPAALTGDESLSLTTDEAGQAVLTWQDNFYTRLNLYYALLDGNGTVRTPPTIFRASQGTNPYIETSAEGYGNTQYRATSSAGAVDLSVVSVEPVQVVEGQPLVKNKATAVKAVIRKTGAGTAERVSARLDVGSSSLTTFYVEEGCNIGDEHSLSFDSSKYPLYFGPGEWTKTIYFFGDSLTPVAHTYQASVTVDYQNALSETDEQNNTTLSQFVAVYDVEWKERADESAGSLDINTGDAALSVLYFPLDWGNSPGDGFVAYFNRSNAFTKSVFPVPASAFKVEYSLNVGSTFAYRDILGRMDGLRLMAWWYVTTRDLRLAYPNVDRYVAVVPPDWFADRTYEGAATRGLAFPAMRELVIAELAATDKPNGESVAVPNHELGHSFGLWNDCEQYEGCNASRKDGIGNYASPGVWVDKRMLVSPATNRRIYSFMAGVWTVEYWVDESDYSSLLQRVRKDGEGMAASSPSSATTQIVLATGMFDITGSVRLSDWYVLPAGELSPYVPGSYAFEYLDGAGAVLYRHSFSVTFDVKGYALTEAPFVYALPYVPGTARIVVKKDDASLAEKIASANAPTVTVTSPNGGEVVAGRVAIQWSGSDLDGDDLSYAVLISANDGATWDTAGSGITGGGYTLDTSHLRPGTQYRVKVIATDGLYTAQDSSDQPFTVLTRVFLPTVLKDVP